MKLTKDKLIELHACGAGVEWFETCREDEVSRVVDKLMAYDRFDWANWLIVRLLTDDNLALYAIHAAELVLHVYENKYPDDNRPRNAINAAKDYLDKGASPAPAYDPANAAAANAYANAAYAPAFAPAHAAAASAYAVIRAATRADIAGAATNATTYAIEAADAKTKSKIINYGLDLLMGQDEKD